MSKAQSTDGFFEGVPDNQPDLSKSKDAILRAINRALLRDERDLLEGGIAAETIAEHVSIKRSTVRDKTWELVEDGVLMQVWGSNPRTGKPRESYLPVSHDDARTPETYR